MTRTDIYTNKKQANYSEELSFLNIYNYDRRNVVFLVFFLLLTVVHIVAFDKIVGCTAFEQECYKPRSETKQTPDITRTD